MVKLIKNISVVIPTIGENFLFNTIKYVNSGTIIPREILVIIPVKFYNNINKLIFPKNVRVFKTKLASQVHQRIYGFKKAKYQFVMQLDADIIIENKTLESLYNKISSLNYYSAIAPTFKKKNSYTINPIKKILFGYFINREKNLDVWDTWFDDYLNPVTSDINRAKWLPGGCIMHRKNNLILHNYYKYDGKAYDEDLIHSYFLRKNKINLYCSNNIFAASINPNHYEHKSFYDHMKYVLRIYNVKSSIFKFSKGNTVFFHLWFIQWLINELIRFIKFLFIANK